MLVEILDGMPVGYMTKKQAAEKWGVSEATVNYYIYDSKVSTLRIGSQTFIKKDALKPSNGHSPTLQDKVIDGELYMTVKEAAERWDMFPEDIRRLINKNSIPYRHNGGRFGNKFIMIPKNTPKPDELPGSLEKTAYTRVLRCIQRNGLQDIESIKHMKRTDILKLRGIGPASLRILEQMMSEKGLRFEREE